MSTPKRNFKDAIYGQLARIGKGVSSPKRLELLDLLCQTERSVETLAKEASLSVANTSRHLQILRAARLVEANKSGLHVIYRLADPEVGQYFLVMRKLAEARLAEIEQIRCSFFGGIDSFEPVNQKTLRQLIRDGAVTVLDVRPPEEYQSGHLPQAVSIPLAELKRRLAELPRDREIVAYCRGPYCVLSADAVELLRAEGFKAIRFEEGVLDWQAHERSLAVDALS
ncbi:MAG: metalloregulator ArsR/SmtB family transcription factor [Geopsychrobacter sp.]|nr:metalloregulator ArsR/SmtB family transcription factor [Geopsychrobacter sp.]